MITDYHFRTQYNSQGLHLHPRSTRLNELTAEEACPFVCMAVVGMPLARYFDNDEMVEVLTTPMAQKPGIFEVLGEDLEREFDAVIWRPSLTRPGFAMVGEDENRMSLLVYYANVQEYRPVHAKFGRMPIGEWVKSETYASYYEFVERSAARLLASLCRFFKVDGRLHPDRRAKALSFMAAPLMVTPDITVQMNGLVDAGKVGVVHTEHCQWKSGPTAMMFGKSTFMTLLTTSTMNCGMQTFARWPPFAAGVLPDVTTCVAVTENGFEAHEHEAHPTEWNIVKYYSANT